MARASASESTTKSVIHAILGSDDGGVKDAARLLAQELAPESLDAMSTEIIDGAVESSSAAQQAIYSTLEALQTPPFFGGAKLVWLKSASFLADTQTGGSHGVVEALEALAELLKKGVPEDVRFLISAVDVDKRRSFYKTLTKVAKTKVLDRLDSAKTGWEEGAADLVDTKATAFGLRFEPDALEVFTLLTGGDTRTIQNELEKLDLLLGPKERSVTLPDVRRMVSRSRSAVIFELGEAIQQRNLDRALSVLHQLLEDGETPIGILLVAVVPTVRNLLLARDLLDHHRIPRGFNVWKFGDILARLPAEATAHLPRKKDGGINTYGLGFAAAQAHRFTLSELRSAFAACVEANMALVTTSTEPRIVLEQLLVRTLAAVTTAAH